MPSKAQILNILASEATPATPLHRNRLAEKLGENTYRSFQTQLDRFEKQGLIEGTPDHEYFITEAGVKELSDESLVTEETSEEKLGTTEYQRFIQLGKTTGISPPELIKQTADHVWNGGDFRDLDWVAKAFIEMGIRKDLRERWFHSWRSSLHQGASSAALTLLETDDETKSKAKSKTEGRGGRSYILDADDKVVFVGDGLGDMWYDDAKELALVRAGRGRTTKEQGGQATAGDSLAAKAVDKIIADMQAKPGDRNLVEETTQFVTQFRELAEVLGVNKKPDSTEEMTKLVNLYTSLKEIFESGKLQVAGTSPTTQWIYDKATGKVESWQPGQPPVVIFQQPQSLQIPIQVDEHGNPRVPPNLDTWFKLEDWKREDHRKQESHETKQEIAKSFKDLIGKATSALGHMAEEK